MSKDREFTADDLPLSPPQLALVHDATWRIRKRYQQQFHEFITDVLRGLREPSDRDVRRAIDEAALRYGPPPQ